MIIVKLLKKKLQFNYRLQFYTKMKTSGVQMMRCFMMHFLKLTINFIVFLKHLFFLLLEKKTFLKVSNIGHFNGRFD